MVAVEGEACIVRHVNAAFLRLAGSKRSDLIGRPFAGAVPEGAENGCVSLLDRVYHTGRPECLAEQKHGESPPVYWSYAVWPILGGDDRPVGVMIQVTDSTETAVFRGQAAAMNEALLISGIRQQELVEASEALNARLEAAIKDKDRGPFARASHAPYPDSPRGLDAAARSAARFGHAGDFGDDPPQRLA
jgi:hypothetical protein